MGNQNCSLVDREINNHQAYGSFQLEIQNNKSYALITKTMNDRNGLKQSLQLSLDKRKNIENEGLCQLFAYKIEKKDTVKIITLTYQYITETLSDKAELIIHKKRNFLEEDLMRLGQSISGALKELYRNKIRHGCINCNSILWDGTRYKITDVSSTTCMTLIDLMMREGKMPQPISQKIASLLNQGRYKFEVSKMVDLDDDLFSLGIVILEMGTGVDLKDLYKIRNLGNRLKIELDIQAIQNYIFLLKKKYSSKLQKLVKRLVGLGIESRNTSTSLSQKILAIQKKPRQQHCYDQPFDFLHLFC